jgi:hypothetical protein
MMTDGFYDHDDNGFVQLTPAMSAKIDAELAAEDAAAREIAETLVGLPTRLCARHVLAILTAITEGDELPAFEVCDMTRDLTRMINKRFPG